MYTAVTTFSLSVGKRYVSQIFPLQYSLYAMSVVCNYSIYKMYDGSCPETKEFSKSIKIHIHTTFYICLLWLRNIVS
jgi:hypothetical protein